MMTIAELIDHFGLQPMAAILGVSSQAVWNMKAKQAIPPKHWLAVARAAQEAGLEGITFEVLAEMSAPQEPAPPPSQPATEAAQ